MRIALITDAWQPQVNGVVRTWSYIIDELEQQGHDWLVVHPGLFKTFTAPRYPEIKLALWAKRSLAKQLDGYQPQAIHIATEGPLGWAARRYCLKRNLPFTTSYHTQFPLYLKQYFGLPVNWGYRIVRKFHAPAQATLVPTASLTRELTSHGFDRLVTWTRGVDVQRFHPVESNCYTDLPRPIFVYAGRVATEKNIEAFLDLDLPGSKVVVGDGPARETLQRQYPHVHWAGYQFGQNLVEHYASADVFVFPSKTDTFGIVLLEANACGLPVAAYPVTGPIDVVKDGHTGCLNDDLRQACLDATHLDRETAIGHAQQYTWQRCAQMVLDHLARLAQSAD